MEKENIQIIKEAGFVNLTIQKEREIKIPEEIILQYITKDELDDFNKKGTKIISMNIYADKPCNSCGCGDGCCWYLMKITEIKIKYNKRNNWFEIGIMILYFW